TGYAETLRLVVLTRSVREYENRDEEDFPVDLVLPYGATYDFSSNRQLRPRAIEEWNKAKVRIPNLEWSECRPLRTAKKPTKLLA
ncbi:hypothetical protein, partial [Sphingopyxis granuli]|uniref:hypothetical protein n=1 Tax=Sphingopyxis granuli TaxID=267128 RepID=UPI001A9DD3DF